MHFLHDTGLEFCQATVSSLKRIVHMYITGTVGQLVERPLCDQEVADSIPSRVIPKNLKMVLAALSLGAQH